MSIADQFVSKPSSKPARSKAPAKKFNPSKPEKSVTTFPVAQDITDVATVEQQIEAIAVDIEMTEQVASARIGQRLAEARDLFKYDRREGGFEGWVTGRIGYAIASAYRLIKIHEGLGGMSIKLDRLSQVAQLEAATAEPDVKAIIAERVEAGEVFTAAQVKEIKAKAAEEAIAQIRNDADKARQDLAALRSELDAKDEKSAAETKRLQASVEELTTKLKGYEAEVEKFKKSLPKPAKAKEQAAEIGGVVLATDGKFHSGSSPEQKRASNAFLSVFSIAADLSERKEPSAIVAIGCPEDSKTQFSAYCDAAIAYLTEVKDNLNGQ